MTRTLDQILADIIDDPGSDHLRLEYAHGCEVKDPARAEYIRVEIELPRQWELGRFGARRGAESVGRRAFQPLEQYCYSPEEHDFECSRGFVESVTMDPYVFIEHGEKVLRLAPIQHVTFIPKPLATWSADPPMFHPVPSPIPELMRCPHLGKLRGISFDKSTGGSYYTQYEDVEAVLASPYLDRMLWLSLPVAQSKLRDDDDFIGSMWQRALARPEFRKMLVIRFPGQIWPGEGYHVWERDREGHWERVTESTPMPSDGRALEETYGYVPVLHHVNHERFPIQLIWKVLSGQLPKFPAGARVTEAMYELPPPKLDWLGTTY